MQHQTCNIPKNQPYFMKVLKDRNTCCCKYHVELDLLKVGLNYMKDGKKGLHAQFGCQCHCNVCSMSG